MVSKLTTADILAFLGVEDSGADDARNLETMQAAAVAFICGYTGLTAEEVDALPDMDFAALVLIQDMYDNRSRYVDKSALNQTAEAILNMHARALL